MTHAADNRDREDEDTNTGGDGGGDGGTQEPDSFRPMDEMNTYPDHRHGVPKGRFLGTPNMNGPPSRYSLELAKEICTVIATSTCTLRQLCEQFNIPMSTLFLWLNTHQEFQDLYYSARTTQQEIRADEILEIADNASNDWMTYETKAGRVIQQFNYEHVKRSELRIKSRYWLMERLSPKRYGARISVESKDSLARLPEQDATQRLADAIALIAKVRDRLRDAEEHGEISDADFEDLPDRG